MCLAYIFLYIAVGTDRKTENEKTLLTAPILFWVKKVEVGRSISILNLFFSGAQ